MLPLFFRPPAHFDSAICMTCGVTATPFRTWSSMIHWGSIITKEPIGHLSEVCNDVISGYWPHLRDAWEHSKSGRHYCKRCYKTNYSQRNRKKLHPVVFISDLQSEIPEPYRDTGRMPNREQLGHAILGNCLTGLHDETIKSLLVHGVQPDGLQFIRACERASLDTIKLLFRHMLYHAWKNGKKTFVRKQQYLYMALVDTAFDEWRREGKLQTTTRYKLAELLIYAKFLPDTDWYRMIVNHTIKNSDVPQKVRFVLSNIPLETKQQYKLEASLFKLMAYSN